MMAWLRGTRVWALLAVLWKRRSPPRDPGREAHPPESARSGGANDRGAGGEVDDFEEFARVRDGVLIRGRTTPPAVRPGTEREAFLAAAARALEVDARSLDLGAPIVAHYEADEFQVYECVLRAEDVWRVQLLPPRIAMEDFPAALEPFRTLDAIIAAAEAAARR